jgi:prepilin-type N-terminal cleavage/methylation domain-containing protein
MAGRAPELGEDAIPFDQPLGARDRTRGVAAGARSLDQISIQDRLGAGGGVCYRGGGGAEVPAVAFAARQLALGVLADQLLVRRSLDRGVMALSAGSVAGAAAGGDEQGGEGQEHREVPYRETDLTGRRTVGRLAPPAHPSSFSAPQASVEGDARFFASVTDRLGSERERRLLRPAAVARAPQAPRPTRGFTLLELLIVVAIIAVAGGIAALSITRTQARQEIGYEFRILKSAIERTRALAGLAGGRLLAGLNVGGCAYSAAPPAGALWVEINPGAGTYTYPEAFTWNPAVPELVVTCRTVTLGQGRNFANPNFSGVFTFPAATVQFGFTATGRLFQPSAPVFVQVQDTQANHVLQGFRVLASGVVCNASDDTGAQPCDIEL